MKRSLTKGAKERRNLGQLTRARGTPRGKKERRGKEGRERNCTHLCSPEKGEGQVKRARQVGGELTIDGKTVRCRGNTRKGIKNLCHPEPTPVGGNVLSESAGGVAISRPSTLRCKKSRDRKTLLEL